MTLYNAICLLHRYGYLTDEEAHKGCDFALKNICSRHYQCHTERVEVALYRHFDNKYTISLIYGPSEEDIITITEKEIPELGK